MSLIKYLLALTLCLSSLSTADVAYVTVQSASGNAVTSLSTPSITPTGSNRLIIAVACLSQYPETVNFTGMTYGGAAMTQITNYGPVQSYFRIYAAYIIAPSTGGGVVTVNLDGIIVAAYIAAVAYSGVDQTTPVGAPVTGNNSNGLATLTISSSSGDMAMDGTIGFGGTITKTGSGTARASQGGILPDGVAAGVSTIAGAASVVQSWTYSDTYSWASVGFNILQAASTAAPTITVDPSNATVLAPATTSFSITATGTAPITYQWQKGTTNVSSGTGGTTATYTIPASVLTDNGSTYRCIATNAYGADTSAAATLTVHQIPIITVDPSNRSVAAGATASFTVTVTGTATITYQWQRGTSDICDATSNPFVTHPTTSAYNGRTYRVIATNAYGADTSGYATLTITNGRNRYGRTVPRRLGYGK